jgi:metal-responsive CopG/Arc/MetJ family transcriptional regulator
MGRPPGRIQHRPFQMRVSDDFLEQIDVWRLKQPDEPSRAEAIRQLVQMALANRSLGRAAKRSLRKG